MSSLSPLLQAFSFAIPYLSRSSVTQSAPTPRGAVFPLEIMHMIAQQLADEIHMETCLNVLSPCHVVRNFSLRVLWKNHGLIVNRIDREMLDGMG